MKAIAVRFDKFKKVMEFLYPVCVALPKLAISCLYYRIFITKVYRRAIVATATVIFLNWLAALLAACLICRPFGWLWLNTYTVHQIGHCGNLIAIYCAVSIPNVLTDVAILVLPLHGIWHLCMKRARKIGLTITFMTGGMYVTSLNISLQVFELKADEQSEA